MQYWNRDSNTLYDSEDNCEADFEFVIEQGDVFGDQECSDEGDVSAAANVSGLIRLTLKSKRRAETVLLMVNEIETRMTKGVKKK